MIRKIFIIFILLSSTAFAEDIYISQTAQGGDTGINCANSHDATWFNTAGNWGDGVSKIGPGDITHLCGTITSSIATKMSGTVGLPITILFESGAKISRASGNCLTIAHAYILVDGGTNGVIENTDNGTNLGFKNATSGIIASGSTVGNLEVKNLIIQNLYIHSSLTDTGSTGQDLTTAGGIYWNSSGSNIYIHDNIFHDMCWALNVQGTNSRSNFNVYNNTFYNYDHGVGGLGGLSNVNIYNNHFGTTANWDTTADKWHHDGIHVFYGAGIAISNVNIYDNIFDGDWGTNNTAHIFIEGDYTHTDPNADSNFSIYNNVFIQNSGNMLNNGFASGGGTNWAWYNNTFLGAGVNNSRCVALSGADIIFKNNILYGCNTFISDSAGTTYLSGGLNNNLYSNRAGGGNEPFVYQGTNKTTFTLWQSATGQDSNSTQISDAFLNVDGSLKSISSAIDSGTTITYFSTDYAGLTRPIGAAWDIGAYEYNGLKSIGGMISGLGTGLTVTLKNNAGDDTPVSANGTFSMLTSMATGSTYNVTISGQPTGMTCEIVSGATGTVASANVTSVAIHCNWTVTSSAGTGCHISPLGAVERMGETGYAYSLSADSGYSVSSGSGTCGGNLFGSTYMTNNITADCTVIANCSVLSPAPYGATMTVGSGALITGVGTGSTMVIQ